MDATEHTTPISIPSAGALDKFLSNVANRKLDGWKDSSMLVRAWGSLRQLDDKLKTAEGNGWPKVYAFQLESEGAIVMDAPRSLLSGYRDGDLVEIIGFPTAKVFNSKLSFKVELVAIRYFEGEAMVEQHRQIIRDFEYLRGLQPGRHCFPIKDELTISLIHSSASSARVDEDFRHALAAVNNRCNIHPIPVKISSAEAIANAIKSSTGDVLVIIRGGGSESDFAAFNEPQLLEALASYPGYRVLGLGHSANTMMADLVCDYSAPVPSAAGTHIRDQLKEISSLCSNFEKYLQQQRGQIDHLSYELSQLKQSQVTAKESALPASDKPLLQRYLPWVIIFVMVLIWWVN